MEWWQTLAVGLSSSLIGGLIAVGGSFQLERHRWAHEAEVRRELREREDAVEARERLATLYPDLFRLLDEGRSQLNTVLVIDTINTDAGWRDDEPVADLPDDTQRLRDAAVEGIGNLSPAIREFMPELGVNATYATLVAIEELLLLLDREFEFATAVGLVRPGEVTPELIEEVSRRMAHIRRCAREELGHRDTDAVAGVPDAPPP